MSSLARHFSHHFAAQFPHLHPGNTRMIVGISGGLDSVVLAHLLKELGYPLVLAHVNYRLRGEESEADEVLVRQLSEQWQTPLETIRTEPEVIRKGNLQANARQVRYAFFKELQLKYADSRFRCFLSTAHHLDDQAETVLLQQFRGTGLNGLAGIRPLDSARKIIRPLLPFRKADLKAYAGAHQLSWREDMSNESNDYGRNRIRNELTPFLAETYPQIQQTLAANAQRLQEAQLLYQWQLNKQLKSLVKTDKAGQQEISLGRLLTHPARHTLLFEMLQPTGISASAIDEWMRMLESKETPTATWHEPGWQLIKDRNRMLICPEREHIHQPQTIESISDFPLMVEGKRLQLMGVKAFPGKNNIDGDAGELWVSAARLQWPLLVRTPRPGDYFYPLGLNRKKKVARFFIDQKLNTRQKEEALLLCSGDYIVWVMSFRMDHRFAPKDGEPALHLRWG